jgi:hypothetical protein
VARILAVFDDLLLGANVLGMLRAAGHDAELTTQVDATGVDLVVVPRSRLAREGGALVHSVLSSCHTTKDS